MTDITLPFNQWTPRPHQMKLWRYLHEDGKRAIAVWHRRAGKDEICLHHAAVAAARRIGNYWHCLPEFEQARRSIWTAVNPHTGKRRIDEAFPHEFRDNTNDSTMFIRFKNQSTWACIGSDRYDATMGSSPAGIVYSEFALSNPSAWGYHRPMLEENNGWACFISTPRGHNHCKTMYEHARSRPGWFAELLTVRDTHVLSDTQLEEALAEYRSLYGFDVGSAMYEQEMMCSFNAAILGAFYAYECKQVRDEGRIMEVAALDAPVHRAWDLGMRDDTSIWFWQMQGPQIVLLDHVSGSGRGLEGWRDEIERRHLEHGWQHGDDYVPHDANVKELGTGKTRIETMGQLGLSPMPVPWATLQDGINAVRRALPLCVFHPRCEAVGFNGLEQHRREWNDETKSFRESALHDWTSHIADAFRYLATAWRNAPRRHVQAPLPSGWVIPPPPEQPRIRGLRI